MSCSKEDVRATVYVTRGRPSGAVPSARSNVNADAGSRGRASQSECMHGEMLHQHKHDIEPSGLQAKRTIR